MLVYMFKDSITSQLERLYGEGKRARERGDYKTFFELSYEALDLVDSWLNDQGKECNDCMKDFEKSLNPKDEKQNEIAFNYLDLAISRVKAGKANNILKIV